MTEERSPEVLLELEMKRGGSYFQLAFDSEGSKFTSTVLEEVKCVRETP